MRLKDKTYKNKVKQYQQDIASQQEEFSRKYQEVVEYYENIIALMPGHIYWLDKNNVYLGCNDEQAKNAKLSSRLEIVGKRNIDMPWKVQANELDEINERVMKTGIPEIITEYAAMMDGEVFLSKKVPLKNKKDEIIGLLGISLDITELKKTEAELKKAKEEAEAANRVKTEFIANMSHDIRTPLTGVIGLSEILENTLENPQQKEEARMLCDSGKELLAMLNDILDTVHADDMEENDIHLEVFDLHECIDDLVKLVRPTTVLKHLGLQVEIQKDVPQLIKNDRKKIHRILLNLLGNAIKFTQKGQITIQIDCIKASQDEIHLQFSVIDTGIGIAEEIKDKIFERFFRSTPSYKGIYKGHGLGLHIARSYIELLGGHMSLNSQEGVGTTFSFVLPSQIVSKDEIKPLSCLENKGHQSESATFPYTDSELETKNNPNHNALHILLVEDNPTALKVLEAMVTKTGHQFKSTQTGEEACQLAKSQSFDLAITDVGLPGISGNQLATEIRRWEKEKNNQAMPIIGLTGHAKEALKTECLEAGMNDVFTKPIHLGLMRSILNKHVLLDNKPDLASSPAGPLGPGLPVLEEALFQLEHLPLFDVNSALETVPDQTLLLKLVQEFISTLGQKDIADMQAAYLDNNWEEVGNLAHKFKSGAVYLGVLRLQMACQYLERYYKAGHHRQLAALYQQLITVNQVTVKELADWLIKS